jgi:choline trimethylamine-lyase activating enzyme
MSEKGIIFDIQKFCLHDGPGIRTTVFLKGCNLSCKWCHNPESISIKKQLSFNNNKCVLCNKCAEVCPNGVHLLANGTHTVFFSKCQACGICIDNCITDALKIIGREATVEEVIHEVAKDGKYYEESGGGMTLSGGEATMQFGFAMALLDEAKKAGIHTCLETNGVLNEDRLAKLVTLVDMFLLDYKASDSKVHKDYTGAGSEKVLTTLRYLDSVGASIVLRCVVIPGVNNTESHFKEIARLTTEYKAIQYAEIMPYHNIGRDKWNQIGSEYCFKELETASSEQAETWREAIRKYGGRIK